MADPPETTERGQVTPGTRVEVRTAFDRSWANGFVVEAVQTDGYQIRRSSDGSLLPATIAFGDVRRERHRTMWWF